MIDAYEIGIQLALQDGVSAGLELINRELAEVDKAIAITSAGLTNLSRSAEIATKAISRAVQARVSTSNEALPSVIAKEPDQAGPKQRVPDTAATARVSLSDNKSEARDLPVEQVTSRAVAPLVSAGPTEDARALQSPPSLSPPSFVARQETASRPSLERDQTAVSSIGSVDQPRPTSPTASLGGDRHQERQVRPVYELARPKQGASSPGVPGRNREIITSSIAKIVQGPRESFARDQRGREVPRRNEVRTELRHPTVAPWSSTGNEPTIGVGSRPVERAVAPQPASPERSEGSGGTVMLDGRLVGYWLSEQMAQDASRPPSGTSFFDPRQGPAWTASGAL